MYLLPKCFVILNVWKHIWLDDAMCYFIFGKHQIGMHQSLVVSRHNIKY